MGDPFLCLLKTPARFSLSSSHSFLHNSNKKQLRPRSLKPPRLHSLSSSQFLLISTTECLDGSFVFRFGDQTEKVDFDDHEAKRILEATLVSVPTPVELDTSEVGYPSRTEDMNTVEEVDQDAPINYENQITDKEEVDPQKVTNGYPSTEKEDKSAEHDLAEGMLDRTDVSEAAIPSKAELHPVENVEDTALEKSEDEFTEDEANKTDVSGASTATIVDFHTVEEAERDHVSASLLRLSTGAALLPHPSKALIGGEDAYFAACGNWLGVADGVSQWSLEGINPGVYARELMENCERLLSDYKGIPLTKPEDALIRIASQTKSPGSSTVLIGYFDGQAFHVANIGNSGFIIIRNGCVLKRSSPLIHGFNFPLQIVRGVDPSELIERYSIDLDEGDVIVTATDGLFDNLYDQEITSIVTKSFQRRMNLQDIATFLATSAQEVGQSTSRRSPFADAVEASGYVGYTGGKLDDVTVIVSHVHKQ